jgi:hypothetical protein
MLTLVHGSDHACDSSRIVGNPEVAARKLANRVDV